MYLLVSVSLSWRTFIHSLNDNYIGRDGAMALAAAMKTATNLRELWIGGDSIGREAKDAIRAAARKYGTRIM